MQNAIIRALGHVLSRLTSATIRDSCLFFICTSPKSFHSWRGFDVFPSLNSFYSLLKTSLLHLFEKIQASAWTIPAICSILAIGLAQMSLWVDGSVEIGKIPILSQMEGSSPEGLRTFLSTIATSMLAIAGVSFSSIMVTITLASQQFGPRLLRNFIKDKFSQTVLGILIGTFIYCLFIIRRTDDVGEQSFVPQISTTVALLLALLCLGSFIRFVHHIISKIQADEVVFDAYQVFETTIESVFPEPGDRTSEYRLPDNKLEGWRIESGESGYVQAVNIETLVEVARKADLVLETKARSGDFITRRQVIAKVIEGPSMDEAEGDLLASIQNSFFLGPVRTPEQDFEYGIRQLVEVALRALSPGINDPFTAMNCIDYLGAGLQSAFSRPLPGSIHRDENGDVRVFSRATSYEAIVEAAVNQIRQASRERCDVSCRLLEMLAETAKVAHSSEQQRALLTQAEMILDNTPPALFCKHDCEAIRSRFRYCQEACFL